MLLALCLAPLFAAAAPLPEAKPRVDVSPDAAAVTPAAVPRPAPEPPKGWSAKKASVPLKVSRNAVARDLFGKMDAPAPMRPLPIGSYAKGCLAGGKALAPDGPGWQVIRLSRNRNWGHPELIDYLEDLAADAPKLGWNGLMVGDMAQPRGGPMTSGHSSHQIGLDADIWLKEMPRRRLTVEERENVSAVSMLKMNSELKGADRGVDYGKWTDDHARLIRRAAQDKRVARIFVHPGIKQALCKFEKGNRAWLRKIRPWWGHHYHFHVRLSCPPGSAGCKNQNAPPPGDGCGSALAWWLSDEPWVPKKDAPPPKKKPPMRMASLPNACTQVLLAN
ncbi:penicillin-insensitive murein endopeptidase [Stappia sediminis]|nr:penicillin-insensitive murein endopeptidase [Stappia sediminis]